MTKISIKKLVTLIKNISTKIWIFYTHITWVKKEDHIVNPSTTWNDYINKKNIILKFMEKINIILRER